MDFTRSHKTRFLVASALALVMLGLALHQHDPTHFETDHSCLICLIILSWAPAVFIALVLLVLERQIMLRILSATYLRRGPGFVRPPLRAPPQIGP
jgi:hypothetical protein